MLVYKYFIITILIDILYYTYWTYWNRHGTKLEI